MVHQPNMSSPTSQVKLKLMFMLSMFMLISSSIAIDIVRPGSHSARRVVASVIGANS